MLGKVCLMTKLSTKEASAPRTATTFTNSDEGPKCTEKGFNLKGNEIIC